MWHPSGEDHESTVAAKVASIECRTTSRDVQQQQHTGRDQQHENETDGHQQVTDVVVVEPPPSPPKVQDRSRLRANVVLELINSERDFVKHLKNVVEGYLHRARKHPEIFTAQQINTIFANIEQLYEFQRQFLENLEGNINWNDLGQSQVGHCFLRYEKGFSVYHHYCNNHPNATSELQDLYGKSVFRAFFEECRLKQNMIDISLDGFLLTPIQKICKYPLQLNELLKNTCETHPDYEDVASALEAMRNCANLANERKRRIEALADVMSFQERVDNWIGSKLSNTSSILVHSGEVSKWTTHNKWSQGVQLHLFDHLLLYSKYDLLKRQQLILKGRICMDRVTEISDADEYKPRKSFKLYCSEQEKWFVFATKTEREKDEWIRAFERERGLVEADENEGFRITDRELGIARRALLHRKRSRSARYRHGAHNGGATGAGGGGIGGGGGGGAGGKRPDTTVADQLDLDDSNLIINRTLSLPTCIHPSHVMNFVEAPRVVSVSGGGGSGGGGAHHSSSSGRGKKNSSPSSNSRGSPMAPAGSQQQLAGPQVTSVGQSDMPGDQAFSSSHGPTNWLRKMGSKKLSRGQVYQINGQTGQQQQQQQPQHQSPRLTTTNGGSTEPLTLDVDATALKYDELEKRHRDHMVSEQQARLYRLNNDLPPPPTLYPQRSLTPTPFGSGSGGGGGLHHANQQTQQQGLIGSNRPKSSPSHHHLMQQNNYTTTTTTTTSLWPPLPRPHASSHHSLSTLSPTADPTPPRVIGPNEQSQSLSPPMTKHEHNHDSPGLASLEDQLKESLSLKVSPGGGGGGGSEADQHQTFHANNNTNNTNNNTSGSRSSSQTRAPATFETTLRLSSGRIVHVREDAV